MTSRKLTAVDLSLVFLAMRQTVNILNKEGQKAGTATLPKVFDTPIRADLVQFIYTNLAKNAMQPHATDPTAGVKVSAISWGPGRAKARVPRVNGSGTNRSGQGAYANFCRGGHKFGPPSLQRRWFRPVPVRQRRYAIASALAATAVPSLLQARGHRVESIEEVPVVASDDIESVQKTRDAVAYLKALKVYSDVEKVIDGKVHRSGKGKMRRSAYRTKKGPLVVYAKDNGVVKAFRNIPGVDVCPVDSLSLSLLAPGAQMGRLVVWSESAFKALDEVYENKLNFNVPRSLVSNADIDRVILSDEVQSVLRPKLSNFKLCPCKCNLEQRICPAVSEWADALKQIEALRAQEQAKAQEPAAVKALFEAVMASQAPAPSDMTVHRRQFE